MAMLRFATDCSLSLNDVDIERRPYHKNCGCALHKLKGVSPMLVLNKIVSPSLRKSHGLIVHCPSTTVGSASRSFSSQTSYSTDSTLPSFRIKENTNGALLSTNGRSN
ncbi:hypothetical protein Patl1_14826 [Pistacia atlantica]|uniref:Uncharacterized protein n=1 Tax=Pistacia atlantica TaxID=434234 RepID=A0ACC1ATL4_9ROSI|nr:hypothetical protein Patl1_14826 [Pistacia atlantica]